MGKVCQHEIESYYAEYYRRHVEPSEPAEEVINRARLWQCPDCGKWYSLTGHVLRPPLILGE